MKDIKEIMPHLLALEGRRRKELLQHMLRSLWRDIVGEKLSHISQPTTLEDGCLTIELSDADWLPVLQEMKHLMRKKINDYLQRDYITSLSFQLNPHRRPSRPKGEKPPPRPQPEELSPEMKEIVEKIPDQELRAIFSQTVRRYLALSKKPPS
ncbi:MAG: DUF721 domain-containing protein [Acidobacteriota bacterium]